MVVTVISVQASYGEASEGRMVTLSNAAGIFAINAQIISKRFQNLRTFLVRWRKQH